MLFFTLILVLWMSLRGFCCCLMGWFSKIASFGDLGFTVCGPIGRFAVDIMIVLAQAEFCVSYLIFIANTLVYVAKSSSLDNALSFSLSNEAR